MSWGIELPFDSDFVTYVWFDALLNYLTGAGYPDGDWQQWWPADVQVIGKDILTTHSVYWTTMLMAMGVPLPDTIFAHGWWVSSDGGKIGKSEGNAIDVGLLAESFGVDATRFFFLKEIKFGADGGFSYEIFLNRYNADLANDLGNLAHRALNMTSKWLGGEVPELVAPNVRAEVKYGENSRIDFLLTGAGPDCYVEVKSVTLCRTPGLAEFPDSVTARGTKHLGELAAMAAAGHRAVMLYLVQRTDCGAVAVAGDIDPAYAAAFGRARAAGVEAMALDCAISPDGVTPRGPVPVRQG